LTVDTQTLTGLVAALCTTLSYVPQVRKTWTTGETSDLSLRMLLLLIAGLTLWCIYGLLRSDMVIVIANALSCALVASVLYCKLRQPRAGQRT
jgi:MtN3 and saliva related transmembrane protein